MMKMSPCFKIMSRRDYEKNILSLFDKDFNGPCNVIGCYSSHEKPVERPSKRVLNLNFDDVDTTDYLHLHTDGSLRGDMPINCILFTDDMACKIIEMFIENFRNQNWFIFCDVGFSRSPAIADWLVYQYSLILKDRTIYDDFLREYKYSVRPNKMVQRILNENMIKYDLMKLGENDASTPTSTKEVIV